MALAVRIGERVRDRHAHVRISQVRKRCTIAKPNQCMNDRRRVHDDVDVVIRQVEEEMRLDQLEPLVRKRCGVDRDLRAHVPGRVRKRFARCDAFQVLARSPAERPTGGGEHEGVDLVGRPAFEALERPRVLAVDGNETPSPALLRVEGKISRRDEALLVREREIDAALERPQVAGRPAKPTTALRTRSGAARSSSSVRSPPTCVRGASPSIGCEPEEAAQSSSSGWSSMISSA